MQTREIPAVVRLALRRAPLSELARRRQAIRDQVKRLATERRRLLRRWEAVMLAIEVEPGDAAMRAHLAKTARALDGVSATLRELRAALAEIEVRLASQTTKGKNDE